MAVKIDTNLWNELERWLGTGQAKKLGFHSKAQFVTQAVRELLDKYSGNINSQTPSSATSRLEKRLDAAAERFIKNMGNMEKRLAKLEKESKKN